jgi:acyl-CoA reductase-like NAD-dependent aldehyde dehydrogenase
VIAAPEDRLLQLHRSVAGGHAVQQAAPRQVHGPRPGARAARTPAYVRADAYLDHAVENLVDGAMFNSGQCC